MAQRSHKVSYRTPTKRPSVSSLSPMGRRRWSSNGGYTSLAPTITYTRSDGLRRFLPFVVGAILILAMGFLGYTCAHPDPVHAKINGKRIGLEENATLAMAIEVANIETTPGRLLAIDGSVINQEGGTPFVATINGAPAQAETIVPDGASIEVRPGEDKKEPSYEKTTYNLSDASSDGTWGAVREVKGIDEEGAGLALVGTISGIVVEKKKPTYEQQGILTMFNVNTDKKVAALTFDDGPWKQTTAQVLDILKENDAKGTFFVLGVQIDEGPEMAALVKRAYDEGHQVCTHTYSHAKDGAGFDLGLMSHEARVEDVVKGQKAIEKATGASANRMMRAPGGNYSPTTAASVSPYITYEIGWNIDSEDWRTPGTDAIVEALLAVQPGNIILMHDGGGDRSQTVEALRKALPQLKEQGWDFVTVEELLSYNQTPTQ